jgi:hypothetical protein
MQGSCIGSVAVYGDRWSARQPVSRWRAGLPALLACSVNEPGAGSTVRAVRSCQMRAKTADYSDVRASVRVPDDERRDIIDHMGRAMPHMSPCYVRRGIAHLQSPPCRATIRRLGAWEVEAALSRALQITDRPAARVDAFSPSRSTSPPCPDLGMIGERAPRRRVSAVRTVPSCQMRA